jgi:hypothetical protein
MSGNHVASANPVFGVHVRRRVRHWMQHRLALLMLLAGPIALISCRKGIPGPSAPAVTLLVQNRGYFDVNVWVMRSPVARGARLGLVTGGSSQRFRVRDTDLQPGGLMVLQVRAVSGRTTWTTPSLSVNAGTVATLDLIATASGDLSQSRFYTQ